MGKRGPKPKGKVRLAWSADFAYAIGLLATDGCLSRDGRHIDLTSIDQEQLTNFNQALGISVPIRAKRSGAGRVSYRVQFSDVYFYQFLTSIGFTTKKSKTIAKIDIPTKYFFDFLRGCFDGDGYFYSYWDPRWPASFMFYIAFVSASKNHISWLQGEIHDRIGVQGHSIVAKKNSAHQLKYAKRESLKIIKNMYYSDSVLHLARKKVKIQKALQGRHSMN
jgi:hypothetical protein